MSEEEADRSEAPTPKRLEDARRKGEGPRSTDVAVALSYLGVGAFLAARGPDALRETGAHLATLLEVGAGGGWPDTPALLAAVGPLAGLFALPAALVIGGLVAQRALVVAPAKLAPKTSRVSLLSNAKQKFGPSGLFDFAKSAAKLSLLCVLAVALCWSLLPTLAGMARLGPTGAIVLPFAFAERLIWPVVAMSAAFALLDLLWQRFDFERRNRMSHRDIRQETKEADGDPQLKAKRRARAETLARSQIMAEVPKADVVVVNPVHYAVALRWSREPGTAPVCVAKGRDEMAQRIREVAIAAGVPVRTDPPVARALHASVEVGAEVPPETWRAVAALLRYADAIRQRAVTE